MKGRRVLVTGMGGELGSLVASMAERTEWAGDILGFDVDPPRRNLQRSRFVRVGATDVDRITELVAGFNPHVILHVGVWEPHARLTTDQAEECTESVAKAVRMSFPPKQTLVTIGSGSLYCVTFLPSGEMSDTAPVIKVATQMWPPESTASESNI